MEKRPGRASAVMGMIGGLSGIITMGTLVFYGGSMAAQVKALDVRVTNVEAIGTPTLRSHVMQDEERFKSVGDRVTRCENATIILPEELAKIRVELSALNAKLTAVKERVDKL